MQHRSINPITVLFSIISVLFIANCEMAQTGSYGASPEEEDAECYEVFGHCEKSETKFEKGNYFTTFRLFPGCDWICTKGINLRIQATSGQILGAYLWGTDYTAAPGYQNVECYLPGNYSSVLTGYCYTRGTKEQFVQVQHTANSRPIVSGRYAFCGW